MGSGKTTHHQRRGANCNKCNNSPLRTLNLPSGGLKTTGGKNTGIPVDYDGNEWE